MFTAIIVGRRLKSPTEVDLLIVKYGFWLIVLVTPFLAALMGRRL